MHFSTPSATLGSCPAGVRLLETSLCFLLSIPQGPKSQRGHGPPREKETPIHAHADPAPRERPRQSSSSLNLAGGVPRRSWASKRVHRAVYPYPSSHGVRGAGFAQVCWAMPFPEPDSWAGREGRVIDRLNYRLISYLRPRALIGCSLTSSNPAAPRWARRGAAAGGGALLTSPKVISNLKWTLFQLLGASLPLFMVGGKLPPRRRF